MSDGVHNGVTRREVLIGAAGGLALAAAEARQSQAQRLAASAGLGGLVFEDRDGSGMSSVANPGLAGVLVSNGREVAVTGSRRPVHAAAAGRGDDLRHQACGLDAAGRTPDQSAALLSPSSARGFAGGAQSDLRGPRADRTFAGVGDFPLRRQDEPKAFNVVLVTDPQPETGAEVDFIREDLIQALAGVDARFGLTAGDIMFDDLSLYPRSNAIMGTIGLPWWNVGGNHDLNFEAPDRRYSRETFKRVFGPNYVRVLLRADALPHARRRRLSRL